MFGKNTPRWFFFLALLVFCLRIGYKYYRSQQKPVSEVLMEQADTRQQALIERIQANQDAQRAQGAVVVTADSADVATDTAAAVQ